jgi:hypothetical protein
MGNHDSYSDSMPIADCISKLLYAVVPGTAPGLLPSRALS